MANPILFSITQFMENVIALIGRLLIALTTTFSFYGLVTYQFWPELNKNLSSGLPAGPLLVTFAIGWVIATSVLDIWDMASDVVMYCFMFDWDRKGSRPFNYP